MGQSPGDFKSPASTISPPRPKKQYTRSHAHRARSQPGPLEALLHHDRDRSVPGAHHPKGHIHRVAVGPPHGESQAGHPPSSRLRETHGSRERRGRTEPGWLAKAGRKRPAWRSAGRTRDIGVGRWKAMRPDRFRKLQRVLSVLMFWVC